MVASTPEDGPLPGSSATEALICEIEDAASAAARDFYQKYEPKEVLGKGLSSVVRRCLSKQTGKEFAVKIMDVSDNAIVNEDGFTLRDEIHREADALKRVSGHPNIVTLHDMYESDTFIFLVFELCRNGELFDYLTSKVRLPEKRVRLIMKQVLEAVAHCHKLGVVHRDLKPENILLDESLNVKLTDFGFARVLQDDDRLFEVCGTPGYLAPELLKAGMLERHECSGYSFQVDTWACGVIMFTLLVGCPPFWHRRQLTMIRMIMEAKYSFSSPDWNSVTDEARDLISKFLIVEPNQRITAAEALKHHVFKAPRVSITGRAPSMATLEPQPTIEEEEPVAVSAQEQQQEEQKPTVAFNARKAMKVGLTCVRFLVRFSRLPFTPELVSLEHTSVDPYSMRMFRKVIDANAFQIYSHWVKRGEGQNRAALFQHYDKRDLVGKQHKKKHKQT